MLNKYNQVHLSSLAVLRELSDMKVCYIPCYFALVSMGMTADQMHLSSVPLAEYDPSSLICGCFDLDDRCVVGAVAKIYAF